MVRDTCGKGITRQSDTLFSNSSMDLITKKRASENYMVGDRDSFQLIQMMKKVVTDCESEMHLDDDRDTDDRSHHPPSAICE